MNFSELLNNYIKELKCSSSQIAFESGLSMSTISRYRTGNRTPNNPSKQLDQLINGLVKISKIKKNENIDEESIRKSFNETLQYFDIDKMIDNFNQLIKLLKINISDFSKFIGFDPSHLSRIRSKERKPFNPRILFDGICNYIINNYSDDDSKKIVSLLINCPIEKISNSYEYKTNLSFWLSSNYNNYQYDNDINKFLVTLNDFDLNEYIRVIKFDELKIFSMPFKIPKSKNYYGLEEMKQGELEFLKATVLSKEKDSVFMCSDMQMNDMAKDLVFGKKWMFGIAMMLKKGLHLNVIHNLDRPFNEMMIGLESWIPIYMTGQITPFYFQTTQNNIYSHLNYVSSDVALSGECIKGHHSKAKYYLTNNKKEVEYYKEKSRLLLKKAKPLMKIFCDKDAKLLNNFLNADVCVNGNRKKISSSLPIYSISEDLLLKILTRNNISAKDKNKITKFVNDKKQNISTILKSNSVQEILSKISKEEFIKSPISLDLSELFYDKKITYNYEEYLKHFKETKKFAVKNNNYSLTMNTQFAFRNIQITIHNDKWVMISKSNNPTIHFIIEHPKLCKAIENFTTPIVE